VRDGLRLRAENNHADAGDEQQPQLGEGDEAPVGRLDDRSADAGVPLAAGLLVGHVGWLGGAPAGGPLGVLGHKGLVGTDWKNRRLLVRLPGGSSATNGYLPL
jgi:hypothetical protein